MCDSILNTPMGIATSFYLQIVPGLNKINDCIKNPSRQLHVQS